MTSVWAYSAWMGLTAVERLVEMVVSRRNAAWSFAQGGTEHGQGHYPAMVVLHTAFLFACPLEVWLLQRPFIPVLGWSMLVLSVMTQILRWWCITTLGPRWNTRVIIVPGLPRITNGPYRYFRHPNYMVVVTEGIVLPMIHTAWLTALAFTCLNAWLLWVRLRCEERALADMTRSSA